MSLEEKLYDFGGSLYYGIGGKRLTNDVKETVYSTASGELTTLTTMIGTFLIKTIKDKVARTISFNSGDDYYNNWMEDAFYAILYRYNNLKKSSNLKLAGEKNPADASVYYRLGEGFHRFKYRNYDIMVYITDSSGTTSSGRPISQRNYQVITFNLGEKFVIQFEKDMLMHRDRLLKFKTSLNIVEVWKDGHESDGFTYWEKCPSITKRPLNTLYLPMPLKQQIVDTVNRFFSSKSYYEQHGIPWNLKILLSGDAGVGKDCIARTIASAWHRSIFYVTGGKNGRFVPNALTSALRVVSDPLFMVSDIDRYPFLINDELPITDNTTEAHIEENKLTFAHMINALDGIMSGEDRIIIMTTNHPEKFSPTFMRPGRIDVHFKIPAVGPEVFRRFTYDYYGKVLPKDIKLNSDNIKVPDLQADVVFLKLGYEEFISKYTQKKSLFDNSEYEFTNTAKQKKISRLQKKALGIPYEGDDISLMERAGGKEIK